MRKLSTGADATLGEYRKLAVVVFGVNSAAVKFLDDKIKEDGANDEVIVDEGQMVQLLGTIHLSDKGGGG